MTSIRDWCPDCKETGWACKCGGSSTPAAPLPRKALTMGNDPDDMGIFEGYGEFDGRYATPSITDDGIGDEGLVAELRAKIEASKARPAPKVNNRAKTITISLHAAETLLRTLAEERAALEQFRAAFRETIKACGGIAEPGVTDQFLLCAPGELAGTLADREKRIGELEGALRQIEKGPIIRFDKGSVEFEPCSPIQIARAALSNNLDGVVR